MYARLAENEGGFAGENNYGRRRYYGKDEETMEYK